MPQQLGNTGARATAWAKQIVISSSPQVGRVKELKESKERLGSLFGSGEPPDDTAGGRMEASPGYDLEKVPINHSPAAEETPRQLNARAFTFRGHISALRQSLDTSTKEGLGLLTHEFTGAIQQTQSQRLTQNGLVNHEAGSALPAPPRNGSDVQMVLLAAANVPATASPRSREAQAQASAQLMAEDLTDKEPKSPPEISPEAVADRVYHLMKYDLILERERATRVGGQKWRSL